MNDKKKLAIHGEKPIRDVYLPYGKQWIDDDDIEAIKNALNRDLITTSLTFAASVNAILYFGGKPVFADIDPKTYNISSKSIKPSQVKCLILFILTISGG